MRFACSKHTRQCSDYITALITEKEQVFPGCTQTSSTPAPGVNQIKALSRPPPSCPVVLNTCCGSSLFLLGEHTPLTDTHVFTTTTTSLSKKIKKQNEIKCVCTFYHARYRLLKIAGSGVFNILLSSILLLGQ